MCPHWTAAGGSLWSRACGGWRWCRGWLDSWVTARGCSRAAWGSDPGPETRAEGWEGWSHTAAEWFAHPQTCTTWWNTQIRVYIYSLRPNTSLCACVCFQCCTDLLPLLLAGASAIQVQRERSWSSWAWWSTVKAASVRSSTCRHRNLFISWQRTVVFMFAAFLQVSPGLFKPTASRLLKPFSSHYMLLWMQMQK